MALYYAYSIHGEAEMITNIVTLLNVIDDQNGYEKIMCNRNRVFVYCNNF